MRTHNFLIKVGRPVPQLWGAHTLIWSLAQNYFNPTQLNKPSRHALTTGYLLAAPWDGLPIIMVVNPKWSKNLGGNAALKYVGMSLLVIAMVVVVWYFLLPTPTCEPGVPGSAGTHIVNTATGRIVETGSISTSTYC